MSPIETAKSICVWCGAPFPPRKTGGSPQRFCRPSHRGAYYSAARRYVDSLVAVGELPVEVLKASGTACTLPGTRPTTSLVPDPGETR